MTSRADQKAISAVTDYWGGLNGDVTSAHAKGLAALAEFASWWNTPDPCVQAYLQEYYPRVARNPGYSLLSVAPGPWEMFPGGTNSYWEGFVEVSGVKGLISRIGKYIEYPLKVWGAATIPYATTAHVMVVAHCSSCDGNK